MANVVALDGAKWGSIILAGDLCNSYLMMEHDAHGMGGLYRMEKLQAVLSGIWKWMVSFTGTVAAACLIACAVVLLAELFIYRKKKHQSGRA